MTEEELKDQLSAMAGEVEQEVQASSEPVVEQELSIEEKARLQGWRPKEEFHGNPDDWVDAKEFVRGGSFMKEINRLKNIINTMSSTITKSEERAYKRAVEELTKQKEVARLQGDIDSYEKALQQEQALKQEFDTVTPVGGSPTPPVDVNQIRQTEYFKRFEAQNPWVNGTDAMSRAKQTFATQVAVDLEKANPHMTHEQILEQVSKQVSTQFDKGPSPSKPPVVATSVVKSNAVGADESQLNAAQKEVLRYLRLNNRPDSEIQATLKAWKEQNTQSSSQKRF